MPECHLVYLSPNRPHIFYEVKECTSIDVDFAHTITDILESSVKATRVLVYFQSLNMCSELYSHFLYELGIKATIHWILKKWQQIDCLACTIQEPMRA